MATFHITFLQRNPRYGLLLGFFLVCSSLLLLVPWHATTFPNLPSRISEYLPTKYRGSMSLEEFVWREEDHYQQIVRDRQELIRANGPTPDRVNSFPPGDIFYVLWDFYVAGFNCPHRIQRLGNLGDGGKWICGVERLATQRTPCVVYSFGVNHDSSFEASFLSRAPNCQVWGYDFSVSEFGPQTNNIPELRAKTHFHPYMLAATDKPHNDPQEYTINTLMEMNGHNFIDVLKIDIEGGEFVALESFLRPYSVPGGPIMPVGQLEIEIHAWSGASDFAKFNPWWELLEKAGFRPFWTEPNLPYVSHLRTLPDVAEYSFINIKGRHALITDNY